MVSTRILSIALCLLMLMQSNAEPTRRDLSSLVKLLSQKYSGNKPLLVILDSGSRGNDKASVYRAGSSDTSSEDETANIARLLLRNQKAKYMLPIKKSTTRSHLQLKVDGNQLHRLQRLRENRDRSLNDKNVLRSPIVKKLLRISNHIQCNAKDDCQDKCNDKYKGNKIIKCNLQCEIKYDCDEEEKDPCDGNDCADSCGNSVECLMSTKGERYVTEASKCKRC